MSLIKAIDLHKSYGQDQAEIQALRGVGFEVESGAFTAIVGESGSGKSTLLSIMGALLTPTKGRFLVDDLDIYSLTPDQQADFRREFLGFVFQDFHLIPYLTVIENVMLPLATTRLKNAEKEALARSALDRVGLTTKAERLPSRISGGEQERAALARAIVNEPPILLADEPTGNLDTKTSGQIMNLLGSLNREGMTIIMVTHSTACAERAERILTLSDGLLIGDQSPAIKAVA